MYHVVRLHQSFSVHYFIFQSSHLSMGNSCDKDRIRIRERSHILKIVSTFKDSRALNESTYKNRLLALTYFQVDSLIEVLLVH